MTTGQSLAVDSVTGVDVALPVAGPGIRSFAFLIDWSIRTTLAIAWYVVAALLHNRGWSIRAPLNPGAAWFMYVVAPPAVIYFLYHPVWEAVTRGGTPGKRIAGVQLVGRDGRAPGIGSLLTRNVFRLIDSFPVAYAVGLVTTMVTRNHARIGDLAAGTLLVYVHADQGLVHGASELLANGRLDPRRAEIITELLRRWPTLDGRARRRLAQTLLAEIGTETEDDAVLHGKLEKLVTGPAP